MKNKCFIDDIEDEYKWYFITMEIVYNENIV